MNTHSVDTKHPEQGQRGGGAGLALRTASHSSRADEQTLLFWAAAAHPASAAAGVGQRSHLRSPRKACSGQRRGLGCCGHPSAPCLLQETASVGPVKPRRSPWGQAEAGHPPTPPPAASSQLSGELSLREPHARGPVSGRLQHSHLLSLFIKSWG